MREGLDSLLRISASLNWGDGEEILFYFTVYAFAGWWLENGFSWVTQGQFPREGLMVGPFKPMYGFAPVLMLLCVRPGMSWLLIGVLCLVIPTAVEYASGWLLLKLFHHRWWDYSASRYQLYGLICLPFSLCWLVLMLACLILVQPPLAWLFGQATGVWQEIAPWLLIYLLADLSWTVYSRRKHMVPAID